jgi:hypothetical protein
MTLAARTLDTGQANALAESILRSAKHVQKSTPVWHMTANNALALIGMAARPARK